jgi:hypothetical protein
MRPQRDEPVEAGGKAVERFAGQADDEVGVDVDAGVRAEPKEILRGFCVVLAAADPSGDFLVEGLDADFELQRGGREFSDEDTQRFGKAKRERLAIGSAGRAWRGVARKNLT